MALKGVVWDVGNVIVRWDPRTLYSKIFPDEAERDWFLANVCTMPWHMRHDAGVPFEENRRPLLAQYPDYAEAIDARLEVAAKELAAQDEFAHRIVNDDLGRAADALEGIVRAELGLPLDSRAE